MFFVYLLSCFKKIEKYHNIAVIIIDFIYTSSYFERVF